MKKAGTGCFNFTFIIGELEGPWLNSTVLIKNTLFHNTVLYVLILNIQPILLAVLGVQMVAKMVAYAPLQFANRDKNIQLCCYLRLASLPFFRSCNLKEKKSIILTV